MSFMLVTVIWFIVVFGTGYISGDKTKNDFLFNIFIFVIGLAIPLGLDYLGQVIK